MRKLLIPAAVAAAFLFVAQPSEAKAQVGLPFGGTGYGYPYYGGSGFSIGNGRFNLSFGSGPYYGDYRGYYAPYYGTHYGWYGHNGWYGNRGWYGSHGWSGYHHYHHHGHHR